MAGIKLFFAEQAKEFNRNGITKWLESRDYSMNRQRS